MKKILGILFICLFTKLQQQKQIFILYKQYSQAVTSIICEQVIFGQNASIVF